MRVAIVALCSAALLEACALVDGLGGSGGSTPEGPKPMSNWVIAPRGSGGSIDGVALTATDIYFTDRTRDEVKRVGRSGGSPAMLGTVMTPGKMIVAGEELYMMTTGGLQRMPRAGGSPTLVAENVYDIAADDAYVYFSAITPNRIERVPYGGGASTMLTTSAQQATDLTVSGGQVYYLTREHGPERSTLWSVAVTGGSPVVVFEPPNEVISDFTVIPGEPTLVVYSTFVLPPTTQAEVRIHPLDGGAESVVDILSSGNQPWVHSLSPAGNSVFYLTSGSIGWDPNVTIRRLDVGSKNVEVIASSAAGADELAADAGGAVWATYNRDSQTSDLRYASPPL